MKARTKQKQNLTERIRLSHDHHTKAESSTKYPIALDAKPT